MTELVESQGTKKLSRKRKWPFKLDTRNKSKKDDEIDVVPELDESQGTKKLSRKRKNPFKIDTRNKSNKDVEIDGQFTLIKDVVPLKVAKVERVLPDWLSNPIYVKKSLKEELKSPKEVCPILSGDILNCLSLNNITNFFPVQQVIIPYILSGAHGEEHRFPPRDICVATPTGSGKTLAFVVPIIQTLRKRSQPSLSAVVILPVKELAKQVYDVFTSYKTSSKLVIGKAFGGENFEAEQKQLTHFIYDKYHSKVDILVATPGRLFDHIIKTPGIDFTQLRFLVLDEADKLLAGENGELMRRILGYIMQFKPQKINLGFPPFFPLEKKVTPNIFSHLVEINDGTAAAPSDKKEKKISFFSRPFEENIIKMKEESEEYYHVSCPPLQRLLFSATLTHDPEQLQNVTLFRPVLFTTGGESQDETSTAQTIDKPIKPQELTEEWVKAELRLKPLILHYVLRKERKKMEVFKCLVFAGSVELASKLTVLLKSLSKDKYVVEEFSSKFPRDRKKNISNFLKGKINVLVSTDAMARGVDVPNIDCVISYDVPSATTYTHRVGRTARAGRPGKAVSILTEEELKIFKKVLGTNFSNVSERSVSVEKLEKFESSFRGALEELAEALKTGDRTGGRIVKTLNRNRQFNKNFKNKVQ